MHWLVNLFRHFRLLHETLFLAVHIVDRFLSKRLVKIKDLQLFGIAAILLGSKYEERYNRDIVDYCLAGDIGYTKIEIICAEREVLLALDYRLSYPNPMNFLSCISKADEYDIQTHNIGKCLMVFTILDHRLVNYRSSQIAAAS